MEKIKNENQEKYWWKKEGDQEDRGEFYSPFRYSINNTGDSTGPINCEFDDNDIFFEVVGGKISGILTTEVIGTNSKDTVFDARAYVGELKVLKPTLNDFFFNIIKKIKIDIFRFEYFCKPIISFLSLISHL